MYSPGVIFSGQVAGLDVNFMSPLTTEGQPEGHVINKLYEYKYDQEVKKLPDGTKQKEFDYDDLKEYYGFNIEEAIEKQTDSDAETWVMWFRKRSY